MHTCIWKIYGKFMWVLSNFLLHYSWLPGYIVIFELSLLVWVDKLFVNNLPVLDLIHGSIWCVLWYWNLIAINSAYIHILCLHISVPMTTRVKSKRSLTDYLTVHPYTSHFVCVTNWDLKVIVFKKLLMQQWIDLIMSCWDSLSKLTICLQSMLTIVVSSLC